MQNQVKTLWRKAGSNDWLSIVMIGLLGFMAWLSYDFIKGMLPPEMGILSVGGLIGLGLGAVLWERAYPVSYTHLRAHETVLDLVCRLLLEKKKHTI